MSYDFLSAISGNATMLPLNKEFDDVTAKFRTSLGTDKVCVSVVYKIHNPSLETAFEERKAAITKLRKTPPEVVDVFHGTRLTAAANIVNTGFDPAFSTVAAYGKGTYASPSVKMALSYCKDVKTSDDFSMIFLCRFLKGKHGVAGNGSIINTATTDYCGSGDILVTPYADGIIPDYLLCYYKWT
jgi:hypothetical protein